MKQKGIYQQAISFCIIEEKDCMAVGFAVRAPNDTLNEKFGIDIAEGRAHKALKLKKNSYFKRPDVIIDFYCNGIDVANCGYIPKSIYIRHIDPPLMQITNVKRFLKNFIAATGIKLKKVL